jgi:hypothetical protein
MSLVLHSNLRYVNFEMFVCLCLRDVSSDLCVFVRQRACVLRLSMSLHSTQKLRYVAYGKHFECLYVCVRACMCT